MEDRNATEKVNTVSGRYLNCFAHCMREMMLRHGRKDIIEILTPPLSFAFEAELGTREWWFGGYPEITFQEPNFNRGVTAQWVDVDVDNFWDIAQEVLSSGKYLTFQTEWALLPISAHYGYGIGDIHTSTIFDINPKSQQLYVFDRMARNFPRDMYGWVDFELYKAAFASRLRILNYTMEQPTVSWSIEFIDILRKSVQLMCQDVVDFVPHVHIAHGFAGMQYFADTLHLYKQNYRTDESTKTVMGVRIPDSIKVHIVGSRMVLLEAMKQTLPPDMTHALTPIIEALEASIQQWYSFREHLLKITQNSPENFELIADKFLLCKRQEEQLVNLMREVLAQL